MSLAPARVSVARLRHRPFRLAAGYTAPHKLLYSSKSEAPKGAPKPFVLTTPPPERRPVGRFRAAFARAIAPFLGYNTRTTTAIRETRMLYAACTRAVNAENDFLIHDCRLPATFQTWFQVTNLYVWLMTTRLRALEPPLGKLWVQELVNHFFLDIEERMRGVLGSSCPERIVKGHMVDMKAQWMGSGVALDQGLVRGDVEMAGAVWRNVFDARGGKEVESRKAEEQDKAVGSAVTDAEIEMPRLLWMFTAHLRRELQRLEKIPDDEVRLGRAGTFGRIDNSMDFLRAPDQRYEVDEVVALPPKSETPPTAAAT